MKELHLIPNRRNINESLALAEEYGAHFEYNEFFLPAVLDDAEEVRRIIDFYKSLDRDRSLDTLHGVFLDITIHSDDRLVREASDLRIHQSMDIARELGVKGVIFHTNTVPNFRTPSYLDNWVKRNSEYFRKLLDEYPQQEVYMENMFDEEPYTLARLAADMKDVSRFGICFDYAHANAFGDGSKAWSDALMPYVKHMHINDNDGAVDSHESVGNGTIDWNAFNDRIHENNVMSSVLVEVTPLDRQRESLEFMKENHIYPFDE